MVAKPPKGVSLFPRADGAVVWFSTPARAAPCFPSGESPVVWFSTNWRRSRPPQPSRPKAVSNFSPLRTLGSKGRQPSPLKGKRLTTFCASLALLHPLLSLTHWIFGSLSLPYKSSSHSAKCVRCARPKVASLTHGRRYPLPRCLPALPDPSFFFLPLSVFFPPVSVRPLFP